LSLAVWIKVCTHRYQSTWGGGTPAKLSSKIRPSLMQTFLDTLPVAREKLVRAR
jgi:hypothetical protein